MIHLSAPDIGVLAVYVVGILFVGFRSVRRTTSSTEEFLLAGRTLTLPLFTMMLVSSWYGGILGVGEFTYGYGISNWVTQGVPYYVFALVFALFLAKKVRNTECFGVPDQLERVYGRPAGILGALLALLISSPAPYLLEMAILLQLLLGWSFVFSISISVVIGASYLLVGGFRSDVRVNCVQFVLMFGGIAVILPYCFLQFGGVSFLQSHLPALHLTWHGGNSTQFIIIWFFIALWTLVDPTFHQCCLAARNSATARRGILLSIVFWFIFDLMTTTAGLYSRAVLPESIDPVAALPLLADTVLPPLMKGVFFVGILATVLSTLSAFAFISAQLLGRDLVLRLTGSLRHSARATQWGLGVSLLLSALLVLWVPSVIDLWYTLGTVAIPGLLVPLLASYSPRWRLRSWVAAPAMVLGWLVSFVWLMAGTASPEGTLYPFGIEPMYPGLVVSIVMWILDMVWQRGAGHGLDMDKSYKNVIINK